MGLQKLITIMFIFTLNELPPTELKKGGGEWETPIT